MNIESFIRINIDNCRSKGLSPKAILLGMKEYAELLNGFKKDNEVRSFLGLPVFLFAEINFALLFEYNDSVKFYNERNSIK